ncbi:MAG: serine/threonine protein kinase [Archangium sp.]|nr:serine/threonine protein kinase [Archangium sp.]
MTAGGDDTASALDLARRHEAAGNTDDAVAVYVRAGAIADAMRALSAHRRFADAGKVALQSLNVTPRKVELLPPEGRRLALLAALCFAKGNDVATAVQVLTGLKEFERAASVMERAGDRVGAAKLRAQVEAERGRRKSTAPPLPSSISPEVARRFERNGQLDLALEAYLRLHRPADAARVADQLGKVDDAAQLFAEAGQVYEAAAAFTQLGETGPAIDNWVRVSRDDPRYRAACLALITLAAGLQHLDPRMDSFLHAFRTEGPKTWGDADAFYALAGLYETHELYDDAAEVLKALLKKTGSFRDAAAHLKRLEPKLGGGGGGLALDEVLKEDVAFQRIGQKKLRNDTDLPELAHLPELPDLPPLPPAPPLGAPHRASPSGVQRAPQAAPRPLVPNPVPELNATYRSTPVEAPTLPLPDEAQAEAPALSEERLPSLDERFAGRYRMGKMLGRGGMAVVFEAFDEELNERVALKLFQLQQNDDALERFRLELKLSRQLSHANVVRLFDIGVHEGRRFITMELLEGHTLRDYMGQPVAPPIVVDWLMQASLGLHAAHQRGVIHRDVKPDNLFLTTEGVVKVMDFGIAKGQRVSGLSRVGMLGGTPQYMSPDQFSNFAEVTPASDLYALGVVAFELLTGKLPFDHPEVLPLLMLHVNAPIPRLQPLNSDVPAVLEDIVLRLLAKTPAERYATGQQLHDALAALGMTG